MKEELRSALTVHGVLCVIIFGTILMLLWCVRNWDTPLKVCNNHHFQNIFKYNFFHQQMQWPSAVPTLVLAEVQSTHTTVLAERVDSLTALMHPVISVVLI